MGNLNWSDLPLETQKRLQQPKNRLSAADKQLRKKLFHGSGWINSSGQIQKFQVPREEKRVKKKEEDEDALEEKELCCVCGHALKNHVSEGTIWRCHQLGKDCFQCECVLRKDRAENKIAYYQLDKRIKEFKDKDGSREAALADLDEQAHKEERR